MAEATLGALLDEVRRTLSRARIGDPALEARILLGGLLDASFADLVARPETPVGAAEADAVRAAAKRRIAGEPPYRILGWREFHGLRLALSPATLEPRPDTEALVELAIPLARAIAGREGVCRVLDLGTGSGAIALALLASVAEAQALGTDLSAEALEAAARNAEALGLKNRLQLLRSDWFTNVAGLFDLILSNPPYIPTLGIASLDIEVRGFDPIGALDGGADGLDAYRAIAGGARARLKPHGAVCVEIGFGQRADVEEIFAARGFRLAETRKDLAGIERALRFDATILG